ncbi:MAG: hypothetical protein JKY71_04160 [Alphaproteobacteria bacterium]|nr:hypothetical protein [Alphaproteobacteria bacterium]
MPKLLFVLLGLFAIAIIGAAAFSVVYTPEIQRTETTITIPQDQYLD